MKRFAYFENQEGGMEYFIATEQDDFKQLYGWMRDDCREDDEELLMWASEADVGELFEHRLGCMVRLKDA